MLTEIRIYYEGDGLLRQGLSAFLSEIRDRAREKRCSVRLIPTNGTPSRDFGIAIQTNTTSWNVLLLDSDGPDNGSLSLRSVQRRVGTRRKPTRFSGWWR